MKKRPISQSSFPQSTFGLHASTGSHMRLGLQVDNGSYYEESITQIIGFVKFAKEIESIVCLC